MIPKLEKIAKTVILPIVAATMMSGCAGILERIPTNWIPGARSTISGYISIGCAEDAKEYDIARPLAEQRAKDALREYLKDDLTFATTMENARFLDSHFTKEGDYCVKLVAP